MPHLELIDCTSDELTKILFHHDIVSLIIFLMDQETGAATHVLARVMSAAAVKDADLEELLMRDFFETNERLVRLSGNLRTRRVQALCRYVDIIWSVLGNRLRVPPIDVQWISTLRSFLYYEPVFMLFFFRNVPIKSFETYATDNYKATHVDPYMQRGIESMKDLLHRFHQIIDKLHESFVRVWRDTAKNKGSAPSAHNIVLRLERIRESTREVIHSFDS